VICLDEIKMNLLGKSCICPGFSTVVCNLMISGSVAYGTQFEPWFQEYVSGCGQEIYCTHISPHLAGKTFSQVVLLLYRECNCLLFAIEIVDKQGFARVVLNPASYVITDESPKIFLIAQVTWTEAEAWLREPGASKARQSKARQQAQNRAGIQQAQKRA